MTKALLQVRRQTKVRRQSSTWLGLPHPPHRAGRLALLPSSRSHAAHEASGVSVRRLPGRLLSLALRAICDTKS